MEPTRNPQHLQLECCTPDHCFYPYNPKIHKPVFEVVDSDSWGMKQAKRYWNKSRHECHPTYLDSDEQFRIVKNFRPECEKLKKIWVERKNNEPDFSSTYIFKYEHKGVAPDRARQRQLAYCTPDYCVYPYTPEIHKPKFEILETDSLGMREVKRLKNSSSHECHPNYMKSGEQYRILKEYPKEYEILNKIWEEKARHEPGTIFSTYYDQIKQAELEGKEMIQIFTRKKSHVSQFVDDYPNGSTALLAITVAGIALFFFMTSSREEFIIITAIVCLIAGLTIRYVDQQIISITEQNTNY